MRAAEGASRFNQPNDTTNQTQVPVKKVRKVPGSARKGPKGSRVRKQPAGHNKVARESNASGSVPPPGRDLQGSSPGAIRLESIRAQAAAPSASGIYGVVGYGSRMHTVFRALPSPQVRTAGVYI